MTPSTNIPAPQGDGPRLLVLNYLSAGTATRVGQRTAFALQFMATVVGATAIGVPLTREFNLYAPFFGLKPLLYRGFYLHPQTQFAFYVLVWAAAVAVGSIFINRRRAVALLVGVLLIPFEMSLILLAAVLYVAGFPIVVYHPWHDTFLLAPAVILTAAALLVIDILHALVWMIRRPRTEMPPRQFV
jgi:hypothetical protein